MVHRLKSVVDRDSGNQPESLQHPSLGSQVKLEKTELPGMMIRDLEQHILGWRDGSAVTSACGFSRGPALIQSTHSRQLRSTCNSRGSGVLLFWHPWVPHAHGAQTCFQAKPPYV